jgi:S-(hydroxymethyl)glutathione dehydrogenase / alcohol dehydrogenase
MMKALTYQGMKNVKVKDVPAPVIKQNEDIIVRITSTAICGSDLHLIHNMVPGMTEDYIIGHEPMGIVEETGPSVTRVKKGDRVIIPFNISCGQCFFCTHQMESQCDNSNHNHDTGGYLGFSETYGGYPGGQAEFLRVPYGNFAPFIVPEDCELEDEKLLFMSDIMPTAYWGVDNAGVKNGDTVVILGSGPVGLLAQKFAWMKGANRVIAVDPYEYRLEHAKQTNKVETFVLEDDEEAMGKHLNEITKGGADVVIDCVGMEATMSALEKAEALLKLQGGSKGAIILGSEAVRKFGTLQLVGVYGSVYHNFPLGRIFERNISLKMGQAPVIHYMPELYKMITSGQIDPSDIITHRLPLAEAEHGYDVFDNKKENCIKVVLKP